MKDNNSFIKNFSIEQLKKLNELAHGLGVPRSLIQFKDECILVQEYEDNQKPVDTQDANDGYMARA